MGLDPQRYGEIGLSAYLARQAIAASLLDMGGSEEDQFAQALALSMAHGQGGASIAGISGLGGDAVATPWTCAVCTCENDAVARECQACGSARPEPAAAGGRAMGHNSEPSYEARCAFPRPICSQV